MTWQDALLALGAVTAAINAGAFFAFSNFVMPALAGLPPSQGAEAMGLLEDRRFFGKIVVTPDAA